jgi:hypothetical protein
VESGGRVEVPLEASAYRPDTEYELRSRPRLGRLGELKKDPFGRARIEYTHDESKGIGSDRFLFVARNPGALVSSKTPVQILIHNRPPRLAADILTFGNTVLGEKMVQTLTLTNSGGEAFRGEIRVSPPWSVEIPELTVEPGETVGVPVLFEPRAEGNFSARLRVGGQGGTTVNLRGSCHERFKLDRSLIRLEILPGGNRSSRIVLTNSSPEPLLLDFETPESLIPIQPLSLDPEKSAEVEIQADPLNPVASTGILSVRESRQSLSVPFEVPPLPGKLVVKPFPEVEFPSCEVGGTSSVRLEVSNQGGLAIQAAIRAPDWIAASPQQLTVEPGEVLDLSLEALPAKPGAFREPLVLDVPESGDIKLFVSVQALEALPDPASPSAPPSGSAPLDAKEIRRHSLRILRVDQREGRIEVFWRSPAVEVLRYKFEWLEITGKSAEALKNAPITETGSEKISAEKIANERIRIASLARQAGQSGDGVVKKWHPLHGVEVQPVTEKIQKAVFPAPRNRYSLSIRIITVLQDGTDSPVRTEVRIPLDPARTRSSGRFWRIALAGVAGLALSLLAIRWLQKKRK